MTTSTELHAPDKHVLAIIIDNEAGALMRVVNLFSGRGYNIHSLTVSEVDTHRHISRITVTTYAPEHVILHIIHLLERLVPVHTVRNLSEDPYHVARGLMLIKVTAEGNHRSEILHIANEFGAQLCHATPEYFVLQLTERSSQLERFVDIMRQYGILEIARTGITAMSGDEHVSVHYKEDNDCSMISDEAEVTN